MQVTRGTLEENSSNGQELSEIAIVTFILETFTFDSGVVVYGEIRCLSLLWV